MIEKTIITMNKTQKQFKDFEISDFIDMGSLPKKEESISHRPFYGFNKKLKGETHKLSLNHPVSNLKDVL